MGMEVVPYTLKSDVLPESTGADLPEGVYQAVHCTFPVGELEAFLAKIERWFENRDEVILEAFGTTAQGFGFLVLEWEECEIDPLFLSVLELDDLVEDYSIYTRNEEA
jgi:hypothetical protein